MTDETKYPYELINSLFASVSFKRTPNVPSVLETQLSAQVNVTEQGFPILQIGISVKSREDDPLTFNINLIGLFEYKGDKKEYDHDLNIEFTFERGVYLLWPNIIQLVKVMTAQMGVSPLQLRTPIDFKSLAAEVAIKPE